MRSVKRVPATRRNVKSAGTIRRHVDMSDVNSVPQRIEEYERPSASMMTEIGGNKIPFESKIIVGVEHSKATGSYLLHLYDSHYAVSIRPEQKVVVIAEGAGRGRLRNMSIPFENIFRFEVVEMPIGHNCLTSPVDVDQLGNHRLIPKDKPFVPVMVRLLIKHSTRTDFVSIHDIGATPLPILVPFLSKTPEDSFDNPNIRLKSADDCYTLAQSVINWVRSVNAIIKGQKEPVSDYQELQRIWSKLDFDQPDVRHTLVGAYAAVYVSIHLYSVIKGARRIFRVAKNRSAFPRNQEISDTINQSRQLTIDDFYKLGKRYHEKTNRPIKEALDAFSEHINDLVKRNVTIDSSEKLSFLEENAPRATNIIDPTRKINEKHRSLSLELRHEEQLRSVFKNEGIDVHYLPRLPFLSLLVEYQTEAGRSHYAVIIKKGLHQALKEFLLAHEMGHWFLHISSEAEARSDKVDRFLRSSATRTFLDDEADDFGMAVLFPPAYLADLEMLEGKLSTKKLLDKFLRDMQPVRPKLRKGMRHYISEHIEKYKEFKKAKAPRSILTIEVESIKEEDVAGLLALIPKTNEPFYWVRLDKESKIKEASDNSVDLFGRPKKEIVGATPLDLVVPEERARMRQRAKYREENKKAIYYFTEIQNKRKKSSRQVIVYSFPILNNEGEYAGAMAALRSLDEIETESLPS